MVLFFSLVNYKKIIISNSKKLSVDKVKFKSPNGHQNFLVHTNSSICIISYSQRPTKFLNYYLQSINCTKASEDHWSQFTCGCTVI